MVDTARVARQTDTRERREQTALLRHDAEVRTERNPAARTRRRTVHHRDDGLRAAAQGERRLSRQNREIVADEVERCHLLDVAACREILARARNDENLHCVICVTVFHCPDQIAEHRRIQRIVRGGAVDRDRRNAVLNMQFNMIVHGRPPYT